MYDIRRISDYFKEVHSRYYVDVNGCVYTSLSEGTNRIMINGKRINISSFRKATLPLMNTSTKALVPIPNTQGYFLLYNGKILQRLKTMINSDTNEVNVSIIRVWGGTATGNYYLVSRLVAGCFIGEVANMEVHHIDQDRTNNKVENLEILSTEELEITKKRHYSK